MKKAIDKLKNAKNIAIINHIDPDADCLGSSFACLYALKQCGKDAVVILEEQIPQMYQFISEEYIVYNGQCGYDTVLCLDCGSVDRLGKRSKLLESGVTINIDHHPTNTNYAACNYIDSSASSTGELIYRLLEMWDPSLFSYQVCEKIYTAIAADTGCFKYSNTTAQTHSVVAQLMSFGVDVTKINKILFDTNKWSKILFMNSIVPLIEFYCENKVAVIELSAQFLQSLNVTEQEAGGVSPFLRSIEGVETAVVIKEKSDGTVKVNLRSNEYVDVADFAQSFGGGGHKRAAGFSSSIPTGQLKLEILERLKPQLHLGTVEQRKEQNNGRSNKRL